MDGGRSHWWLRQGVQGRHRHTDVPADSWSLVSEAASGAGPGPVSVPDLLALISGHRCPVVARVNGAVRAGGIGLMAACDIVVAPDDATFAFSEVRIGVVPAIIAVPVLARMNPTSAHEYFLTGSPFDAAEAVRTGLVNRAVPAAGLDAAVRDYTDALVRGGPEALAAAKQLRRTVPAEDPETAYARLEKLSARHFGSAEGKAGITAMLAKEPAPWVPGNSEEA